MHRQMDQEYAGQKKGKQYKDTRFDQYRKPQKNKRYAGPSTNNNQSIHPKVKRYYKKSNQPRKRYKADDLVDNGSDGSLWAGTGNENYLFSSDKNRKVGDIVLINVQGKLKNEVTMELKRSFPPLKKKRPAKKGAKEAAPAAAEPTVAEDDAPTKSNEKIHDRFTSIIMEEINREHILLKAQKNVLYKKRKRLVEVQALIARKDIKSDDTIDSNDFLETTIQLIR